MYRKKRREGGERGIKEAERRGDRDVGKRGERKDEEENRKRLGVGRERQTLKFSFSFSVRRKNYKCILRCKWTNRRKRTTLNYPIVTKQELLE